MKPVGHKIIYGGYCRSVLDKIRNIIKNELLIEIKSYLDDNWATHISVVLEIEMEDNLGEYK